MLKEGMFMSDSMELVLEIKREAERRASEIRFIVPEYGKWLLL